MPTKPRTRGNGQGTAFKRGTSWTAQVTIWDYAPDGTRKRKYKTKGGFKTKRDALAYTSKMTGGTSDESAKITFSALYLMWSGLHYPRVSKDAVNGYKAAYAKCKLLYTRDFKTLKTSDLQYVIDNALSLKGEPISRRSKADIKSLISNMYKYALQNDIVSKDYSPFIVLDKKPKSKKDAFTAEEIEKLWKDYNGGSKFTGYILVMIYTGVRFGELATIALDNVHLDEQYMIGGIKTDAGRDREIPINDKILPIVTEIKGQNKKKLLEIHEKVFYNDFRCTLERLGIRQLNPHCCRHTFFTLMANAGIQPAVITETGGHESYSTTLQYTHIHLGEKLAAVNQL